MKIFLPAIAAPAKTRDATKEKYSGAIAPPMPENMRKVFAAIKR